MKAKVILPSLLLAIAGCGPVQEAEFEFRTAEVAKRDIVVVVESAGIIQPIRTIEVKSKASGEILSMHTVSGDFVDP